MTIREAMRDMEAALRDAGVPDPAQDAGLILASITGLDRLRLLLDSSQPLTPGQEQRLSSLLLRRIQREPLQYLLQTQCFYGRDYYVDSRVLIPRQETETLCELGLSFIKGLSEPRVLDLCTGSGAIAVTVKLECPRADVTATDISADALCVAAQNAGRNGAEVRFIAGDLFEPLLGERFDCILSNPPYVPRGDCAGLQPEVLREPLTALDGGVDGLDFYRRITDGVKAHLNPGGMLLVEVGDGQADAVAALLGESGLQAAVHNDLYGRARVVSARGGDMPT